LGWRVGLLTASANIAGAIFVFLYTELLLPTERPHGHKALGLQDLVMFAGYMIVSSIICGRWCDRTMCNVLSWLEEERTPERAEREATLRLAWRLAVQPLGFWAVAAVLFGGSTLAFGHTGAHAVKI